MQILNEFVAVAVRKLGMAWPEVLDSLAAIRTLCLPPVPLTVATHDAALQIAQEYGYRIYDSLVHVSAIQAGCDTLYSEDLQHGQVINTIKIQNPFATMRAT